MKKTFGKIIALIAAVMMLSVFASCELVTVNVDKDMDQVIASVAVENAQSEDIYKRELVSGFISYGYYYVNNGYTVDQAYEVVFNNLTNNKVIVQYAKQKLTENEKTYTHTDEVKGYLNLPVNDVRTAYATTKVAYIETLVPYVTATQIAEAVYNVKVNFNGLLDSFDDAVEDEIEEVEDETVEARTTPTVDTVDGELVDEEYVKKTDGLAENVTVEELDATQKAAYDAWKITKFNSYSMDVTTTARKSAVNEFVELFSSYGLISEAEAEKIESANLQYKLNNYAYYLELLSSNLESFIITNYEDMLTVDAEGGITTDALWAEYKAAYETQKATYEKDYAAYETALDEATEDSYILYNPTIEGAKYGYIANVLIGFSDAATAALDAFKAKAVTKQQIVDYRDSLLATLIAKDQRATWLQNGYYEVKEGVTLNDTNRNETASYAFGDDYAKYLKEFKGTFVNNTDYTKTTDVNKYSFVDGEWKWADIAEDNYKADFANIVPTEYSFATFMSDIFDATLGTTTAAVAGKVYDYEGSIATVNGELSEETFDKINDLIFAYNTDPGALNTYLGYLYSPVKSNYVEEFTEAAKLAVNAGVGTYYVVATDFGYHIVICTKVVEGSVGYYGNNADETAAFNAFKADLETEGTVAYRFKQAKIDANVEKLVSDVVTYNIAKFIDDEDDAFAVTKYENTYKNLITSVTED